MKNFKSKRFDEDVEEVEIPATNILVPYATQVSKSKLDFYLDEGIREPSYYRNLLQYLKGMQEEDECHLYINTPGGRWDSTAAILSAMQSTQGLVVAHIEGSAYSAGSMIALCAHEIEVSPYADMMIHTASFGAYGKTSDIVSKVRHDNASIQEVMRGCYRHFLTEDELQELFKGVDFWFGADEIVQRLERRFLIEAAESVATDDEPTKH
jgi:ATP-dependent protease ClpP protease subunit